MSYDTHSSVPWTPATFLISCGMVAVVIIMLMAAARLDAADEAKFRALAIAEKQRLAMPKKVAEAYEAGMANAVAALDGTPRGLALTQACMASGFRKVQP